MNVANALSPCPYSKPIGKGTPGETVRNITFNTSKERRLFGVAFRTLSELTKDMLTEFEARGF
ncbi:hypothetical protein BDZ89DRAFT_783469 [Hymenopellis radicata]|nr:hypothetical protein BDZ89DRAFT_783469 [Hymenopellis radicata]